MDQYFSFVVSPFAFKGVFTAKNSCLRRLRSRIVPPPPPPLLPLPLSPPQKGLPLFQGMDLVCLYLAVSVGVSPFAVLRLPYDSGEPISEKDMGSHMKH